MRTGYLRANKLTIIVSFGVCVLAAAAFAHRANAFVYWSNQGTHSIGIAGNDGSHANSRFIATGGHPRGVAVDGTHIYWADIENGRIGRANINGTQVDPNFITGVPGATGVALDAQHLYFTWADLNRGGEGIARANLDGSHLDRSFIHSYVEALAVDSRYIYFPHQGGIGRANKDGSGVNWGFIKNLPGYPSGVAVDSAHLYWANWSDPGDGLFGPLTIGRANLDGSAPDNQFIAHASTWNGIAVCTSHIYWTSAHWIRSANSDGTNVKQHLIRGNFPAEVAADSRGGRPPHPHA